MLVPESSGIEHRLFHGWVAPVQVRLRGGKVVVVILAGCGIELPGRTSKTRYPIVGRLAVGLAVAPDVPVAMSRRAR